MILNYDLIANCIMLQNVIDITDVCHELIQDGHTINAEDLSHPSPCMTEQIKRFGEYVLGVKGSTFAVFFSKHTDSRNGKRMSLYNLKALTEEMAMVL